MEGGAAPLTTVTCNTDRVLVKSKKSINHTKKNQGCAIVPRVMKKIKLELSSWKEISYRGKPEATH